MGLCELIGVFDFNFGCFGFVYGLVMVEGLIYLLGVERIFFVMVEIYMKYIDLVDWSLWMIFGDGVVVMLIEVVDIFRFLLFCYGMDGIGGDMLFVVKGGVCCEDDVI